MLGRTFDFVGALQGAQQGLGVEELLQAAAQQWPVILGNGEVSSQVEYGDLTYLARITPKRSHSAARRLSSVHNSALGVINVEANKTRSTQPQPKP